MNEKSMSLFLHLKGKPHTYGCLLQALDFNSQEGIIAI